MGAYALWKFGLELNFSHVTRGAHTYKLVLVEDARFVTHTRVFTHRNNDVGYSCGVICVGDLTRKDQYKAHQLGVGKALMFIEGKPLFTPTALGTSVKGMQRNVEQSVSREVALNRSVHSVNTSI